MYVPLSDLLMDASVHTYIGHRALNRAEQRHLKEVLSNFLRDWKSHNTALYAALQLDEVAVWVFVDEARQALSGCAKDALQRLMKNEGQHLQVNFFDPYCVVRHTPTGPVFLTAHQLAQQMTEVPHTESIHLYDARIASKHAYLNARTLPVEQSWIAPYINKLIDKRKTQWASKAK